MKRIAVFCGSSKGFSEDYSKQAILLGEYFSRNQIGMVYGGGKIGIMGTEELHPSCGLNLLVGMKNN